MLFIVTMRAGIGATEPYRELHYSVGILRDLVLQTIRDQGREALSMHEHVTLFGQL